MKREAFAQRIAYIYILTRDPLIGNDFEISKYTTADTE
jgi:hypothetical protein